MRADIHPEYKEIKVTCSCGNKFKMPSTYNKGDLLIDVCDLCHPFYTGQQKIVDTTGRVDRFKQRYGSFGTVKKEKQEKKEKKEKE